MKKFIAVFLTLLFSVSQVSFAANSVRDLLALGGVSSIPVASTGTAYSQSIELPQSKLFGLEYGFTSSGTVNVKIETQVCNSRPDTEGSADSDCAVVYEVSNSVSDTSKHFGLPAPIVAKYMRFKFTGQGSNDGSTEVSTLNLTESNG